MMGYKFIIATGGTGGHIFPALSLVKNLQRNGHKCLIVADKRFLGFKSKFPKKLDYKIISSGFFKPGLLDKIIASINIFIGVISSIIHIISYKPKMIISFGGYPSFPTMVAAILLRKPLMIHEQNSVVGRANKWVLRWADIVSVPYEGVKGLNGVRADKIHVVGNLVDSLISRIGRTEYPNIRKNSRINLLVLGGSQGAKILSKMIPQAISKLPESIRSRMRIVQQCRKEDVNVVVDIYKKLSVEFVVDTFFVNVDERLSDAHLVIARSGASTVSELIAAGRPSILIPISISNENHQFLNAKILSDKSAAWIIEEKNLNPDELSKKLTYLLSKPQSLKEASKKSRSLFMDANKNMLKLIMEFCAKLK